MRYKNWHITYNTKPIPCRSGFSQDWDFVHDDYDGGPINSESNDHLDIRCGTGNSVEDCMEKIDDLELEADA